MAQFTHEGIVYEELPGGQARVIGPTNQGPTVTTLPMSPKDRARENRDIQAGDRDETKTAIAVRDESRNVGYKKFDQIQALGKRFEMREAVKNYQKILSQYAAGIGAQPNIAGDQKLINAYAQMLNPTSTVMLGEYEATESPLKSTVFELQNRMKREFGWDGATRLPEAGRKQIMEEMFDLTVNSNQSYNQDRAYFEKLANDNGFDPNAVVGPHYGDPFKSDIERERLAEAGFAYDDQGNVIGLQGSVTDDSPAQDQQTPQGPPPQGPQDYRQSYMGQSMSGVNEGLASTLGFPVDVMTAGLNLIPKGINAAANTDLPMIEDPFLGSQWVKDRMGPSSIYDPSNDPSKQFTRRVGQSVGAAVAPAGFAGSLGRAGGAMLSGFGGGFGGATAQRVAPGNVGAEIAGEMLGGFGTGAGLYSNARRGAQREIEAAVPTVPQLKQQAGDLYRQAETRGVTAGPMQTQQLADDFAQTLRNEGQLGPAGAITDAPTNTNKAFNLINQYAGRQMRPVEMDTVRGVIGEGRKSMDGSDQRLAGILTEQFDDWARPMAPEFDQARDISSRYLQAEDLDEATELARASESQFGASGLENALRIQFRGLDKSQVKGKSHFTDDVTEAIQRVSRGTSGSNFARNVGRFAPTGPISLATSVTLPALGGAALGGPLGAAIGGTLGTAGIGGRAVANSATNRAVDVAKLIARNGGKLPMAQIGGPELERLTAALAAAESAKYLPEKKEKRRGMFGR